MLAEPDVELLETLLQSLFELDEELAVFRRVFHSHPNACEFLPKNLSIMFPLTLDRLRVLGSGVKPFADSPLCVSDKLLRHGFTVIELEWQKNFVATIFFHKMPKIMRAITLVALHGS